MPKIAAATKRSACDRCRAKRVRCPRAEDSSAPCPRCVRVGEPCATGSPGRPGRPRKSYLDGVVIQSGHPAVDSGTESSPQHLSTPRDSGDVECSRTPSVHDEPLCADTATPWLGAESLDHWTVPGDTNFFGTTSTTTGRFASGNCPSLDQSSNSPQPQGLLGEADCLDMIYLGEGSNDVLDLDPFMASLACLPNTAAVSPPSAASSLRNLGEKLERQAAATKTFLSDPRNMVEKCAEDGTFVGMATENPVAVVLTCTNELIDIIRSMTAGSGSDPPPSNLANAHSQRLLPDAADSSFSPTRASPISTETTLLILSDYLALMRLYGSIFSDAYQSLHQMPHDAVRSLKAKAVLRIGGTSTLQDIPARVYAMGIIEVIRSHIQSLEDCLGLPAAYRLAGEVTSSSLQQSSAGMFVDGERARLLHSVMAQDDLQSGGGTKPLVEGIRENMKRTIALFDS
ncbi:hypothetical protein PG985_005317 [Apiospora marii]|uniref:uncharacterized protein n=1 Tax=Apiospora marii TaxID=335849 RepID=UPI003130853F